MTRIFCIIGKSCSGKDTLYKAILEKYPGKFTTVVPCTTRPMREGEVNGANYHFVTDEKLQTLEDKGLVLEKREYNTAHGIWKYFTCYIPIEKDKDYILITTPEGVLSMFGVYGHFGVIPIYLFCPDRERMERLIRREAVKETPDFHEMCRRYLADEKDFSKEKLEKVIGRRTISTADGVEKAVKAFDRIYREANRSIL